MALNPIVFTEKVVRSFLRYQLTAYPFADAGLHAQMRGLLSLDETRDSPLLKGPYVSLSRPFRQGAAIDALVREGVFHPHMRQRIPSGISHLYGHQEEAVRAIRAERATLVSTGTGSGKTECFLYPIVSRCLELRDEGAGPGISAVIVYPMNALAEDQLGRLRGLLAGTGIPFGMYVGKTPELEAPLSPASGFPWAPRVRTTRRRSPRSGAERRSETVYPAEEVCSREIMRAPGRQPRILLTNVKQLELLLTRQRDVDLFANARLDFLRLRRGPHVHRIPGRGDGVPDPATEVVLRAGAHDTVCVATSATIVDHEHPHAARDFASRFFGVPGEQVAIIGEAYEREVWGGSRRVPPQPERDAGELLAACVRAIDEDEEAVRATYRALAGEDLPGGDWSDALHAALSENELVYRISEALGAPCALHDLPPLLEEAAGRRVTEAEVLAWLTLGPRPDARDAPCFDRSSTGSCAESAAPW
jgi:hypothetical protein